MIDLTNRGGAASASARRGKGNRPTKATGEGSKRRREGDVEAVATSGSAKEAKKAKKDDFKCAETMPSGRGAWTSTRIVQVSIELAGAFKIFQKISKD